MIPDEMIELLIDPDPEVRKRGVKELGKSKNPDALPYLAEVYRDDEDPEVRDLARKAGVYIRKQAGSGGASTAQKPAPKKRVDSTVDDVTASLYTTDGGGLYDDEEEEEDLYSGLDKAPLPSELHVSAAAKDRAKGLVEAALDSNIRGDNARATKSLQKALQVDPTLMHDSYTMSLAANVTGMPGDEAMRVLGPAEEDLRKRASSKGGATVTRGRSGTQILMAYGLVVGGVVILIGYLLLAWIDFRPVPTQDDTGAATTIGAELDTAREELDSLLVLFGDESPEADAFIEAFDGLQFYLNGLDTTLVNIDALNMFEAMGLINFTEILTDTIGFGGLIDDSQFEYDYEAAPLDYTLFFVPIAAVLSIILGIMLLVNAKLIYWIIATLVGLAGIAPMAYFYTHLPLDAVPDDVSLADFGTLNALEASNVIGLGFWVSVVGMGLGLLLPFIAMMTAPAPPQEA